MTTVVLRPNATVSAAGTIHGGAASTHAALSDDSDATYVHDPVSFTVGFGTVAIPAGALVKQFRQRARVLGHDGKVGPLAMSLRSSGVEFALLPSIPVSASPTAVEDAWRPSGGGDPTITQATIDNFEIVCTTSADGTYTGDFVELYIDVMYATQPTANITVPTGSPSYTSTNAPAFTWTHAAGSDGGAQAAYQVKVFSAAEYGAVGFSPDTSTATYDSGIKVGSSTSHATTALPNSTTYRVYVRTAQTINGVYHWSAWDVEQFSISITTADVAQVVAIADSTRARILVEVDPVLSNVNKHTVLEIQRSVDGKATWGPVRPTTASSPYRAVDAIEALALATDLPGTSGNHLSTPDAAGLDITGDLTLVAHVAADDWTPSAAQALIAKWTSAGNQRSYLLQLDPAGTLSFLYSTAGSATSGTRTSTANLAGLASGSWKWVAVTVDVDNGAAGHSVRFWTSDDGVVWTQLGSTVTTAGTISHFSGSAPLNVGASDGGTVGLFAGLVRRAQVRSGVGAAGVVGGTLVADYHANGAASYTDPTGKVWTANGASVTHVTSSIAVGDVVADYETGNQVATWYRARLTYYTAGLTLTSDWVESSAAVSWTSTSTWLKNPLQPAVNTQVKLRELRSAKSERPHGVFQVLGRADPVVTFDVATLRQGSLAFRTATAAERAQLETCLRSGGVLLLQTPPTLGFGSRYLAVLDFAEVRPARPGAIELRFWPTSFVEVLAP